MPLALAAAATLACSEPLDVLLISVDTLRADRLSGYGYARPTSPRVDAFLESAVLFEDAHANAAWTLPSLASLLTSTYPATHRCVDFSSSLDPSFVTLAEILQTAGYRTVGIGSHTFLGEDYGLQQGFADYDDDLVHDLEQIEASHLAITSSILTEKAVAWLDERARSEGDGQPWLLWVHYFDPHYLYVEHDGISNRFGIVSPGDLYDGEITFTDRHVGALLGRLSTLGLDESTLVVFLADHGEEFGERSAHLPHGLHLFREVMRVPLAIRDPRLPPRRVEATVQLVDVLPTLLELLGIEWPSGFEGRSLVPTMRGRELPPREVLAQTAVNEGYRMDSLVSGQWKLIADRSGALETRLDGTLRLKAPMSPGRRPKRVLIDRYADPGERRDVRSTYPEVATRLAERLEALIAHAEERRGDFEEAPALELRDARVEELRRLGYLE